ncbi:MULTISPECIES: hypothetical protein [unclassified Synechococcus]|uniref:hypothetical protein n=1 Tax=unclassified Synechococcus TaxID=2626047 RepID=UPI000068F880|nr:MULTISPECIES: hypothetical protein [unclassified Synechococcus]EAQ69377.1 hypothetical protein RS9917_13075 [Synechococcus sp. RS9917]
MASRPEENALVLPYRLLTLRLLTLTGALGASALAGPLARAAEPPAACAAPQPGQYLVVARGSRDGVPVGRLNLETWQADGSVRGRRFLRVGRSYSASSYEGRWSTLGGCGVTVSRGDAGPSSQLLLNQVGRPRVGLTMAADTVVSERWIHQPDTACTATTLEGTVLSDQQGFNANGADWVANAVIQREVWSNWGMAGLAVSSYGGKAEVAAYQGRFTQEEGCLGRIRQQDAKGVTYAYVAILRSDGQGYAYLQTQGDGLTVALLHREGTL